MIRKQWISLTSAVFFITLVVVIGRSVFNENLMGGIFALFIYILLIGNGLLLLILPAIGLLAVYQMLKERIDR